MEPNDASKASPGRPTAGVGGFDRRTLVLSAAVLLMVIIGGMVAVASTSDGGTNRADRVEEGEIPPAAAIPRPGRGRPPEGAGDRGGAEQLALFAVLVASVVGIGLVVFRGGRRARANRAQWSAAGVSGHDGALDHPPSPDPGPRSADEPAGP